MKKLLVSILTLGALAAALGTASAAEQSNARFGLGLNTGFGPTPTPNTLIGRIEVSPEVVVNAGLGFRTQSGDFNEGTNFGLGVSAQYRMFRVQSVNFHIMGGLSYAYGSSKEDRTDTITVNNVPTQVKITTTTSTSDIAIFGGFGAEYFFPNTNNQFSVEIDVGPGIHILSDNVEAKTGSTTVSNDNSAFALSLGDSLSSGVLFTYYF